MAFLKFMTICDDEQLPQNRQLLKQFDISAFPSIYFCNNTSYIDTVNSNSEKFYNDLQSGKVTVMPTVPADLFEYEFQQAYDNGYFGLIIVFPHNRWTDFKHQAEIAKKRFFRKTEIDEQGFMIKFYDSKTFAGGTFLQTLELAKLYQNSHLSAFDFYNFIKSQKQNKFTYVLSKDENFFDSDKGLKGYIIKNNNIVRMNISQYSDSVIFDLFAKHFVDNFEKSKYNISFGYDCDFSGNILGRIEKLSGVIPDSISQYGVSATHVLGKSSVCLSFVKQCK